MDQLEYLVTTTFCDSERGDLAFSALPDAPVMPVRSPVLKRLRLLVRAIGSLGQGVTDSRGPRESGEAIPLDRTATTL
jgi:hypothetical protein